MKSTALCGLCIVGLWVGYVAYNNATQKPTKPSTRKTKQQLTDTRIDKEFHQKHKVSKQIDKFNGDLPTYSRYNYNRRRTPFLKNWF